jgi:hypothetical protein
MRRAGGARRPKGSLPTSTVGTAVTNGTKTAGIGTGRIQSAAPDDDDVRADEQGDQTMARTGRLRSTAVACGGTVIATAVVALGVIGLAGPAGWARPAAAEGDQAVPPGDESTATAPPAGTRPPTRAGGSGSGPVADLPDAGSDSLPIATGALAVVAAGAAVVAVRRSPSH